MYEYNIHKHKRHCKHKKTSISNIWFWFVLVACCTKKNRKLNETMKRNTCPPPMCWEWDQPTPTPHDVFSGGCPRYLMVQPALPPPPNVFSGGTPPRKMHFCWTFRKKTCFPSIFLFEDWGYGIVHLNALSSL